MEYRLTNRKAIGFVTTDNNFLIKEDLIEKKVYTSYHDGMKEELFELYRDYYGLETEDDLEEHFIITNTIDQAKTEIKNFYENSSYTSEDLDLEIESIEDIYNNNYLVVNYSNKMLAYVYCDLLDLTEEDLEIHEDLIDFIFDNFKVTNINDAIRLYKEILLQHEPALYKKIIVDNNLDD